MSKKDKISITREDDFTEIDSELAEAMSVLEETNSRIAAMLQEHARPETPGEGALDPTVGDDLVPESGPDA